MKRIMVTGANGFVGQALCAEAVLRRIEVRGITRYPFALLPSVKNVVVGDIKGTTDWLSTLEGCSVVIHLAARVHVMKDVVLDPIAEFRKTNVDGTLNLARQAADAGVKRFVFISSIGVSGNSTFLTKPFTADDRPCPHDPYSVSKYEAELGLHKIASETGLEITIIRPPLVYGYNAPGNFKQLIHIVSKRLPLPLGAINNKRSFVYVGNLVDLIIKCIDYPAAANQVFLVSDGQDLSTTELLQGCAKALGVKSRLLPIPQKLVEACAIILGRRALAKRLCGNLQVDIAKTRDFLGWEPPFTVAEGLKATALGMTELTSK